MVTLAVLALTITWFGCAQARAPRGRHARNTSQRDTTRKEPTRNSGSENKGQKDNTYTGSGSTSDNESEYTGDSQMEGIVDTSKPEMWYLGPMFSPQTADKMGARGVRSVFDIRTFNPGSHVRLLTEYKKLDISICITFRWMNHGPRTSKGRKGKKQSGKPERTRPMDDVPPTPEESRRSIEKIIAFLTTPEAKALSGKLWVQMYNEISGGPGRFPAKYEDAMFDYATELTKRIRKDAPYVKIAGPAVNGTDVLENENTDNLSDMATLRYNRLIRTINWSIDYADAIDVHLHAKDGPWVAHSLTLVQNVMKKHPKGMNTDIVAFEWSCARFENHTDPKAIRDVLAEIYNTMSKFDVKIAAYGPYKGHPGQADMFQWDNLVDKNGQPHEPFYSFFKELASKQK